MKISLTAALRRPPRPPGRQLECLADRTDAVVRASGREVRLTNLNKPFWPDLKITKGDLIQYYTDVAPYLLPHLKDRAMVMKRYPNGAYGDFFFRKRAPSPRPECQSLGRKWNTASRSKAGGSTTFAARLAKADDLWKPLLQRTGRVDFRGFSSGPGAGVRQYTRP